MSRVDLGNLLAQCRVEGQLGRWQRPGLETQRDTPNQEEPKEHPYHQA
jgi:hypothetical protein